MMKHYDFHQAGTMLSVSLYSDFHRRGPFDRIITPVYQGCISMIIRTTAAVDSSVWPEI
jgi:hypothetical protein